MRTSCPRSQADLWPRCFPMCKLAIRYFLVNGNSGTASKAPAGISKNLRPVSLKFELFRPRSVIQVSMGKVLQGSNQILSCELPIGPGVIIQEHSRPQWVVSLCRYLDSWQWHEKHQLSCDKRLASELPEQLDV